MTVSEIEAFLRQEEDIYARKAGEAISVIRDLQSKQEEVESLKARIEYLDRIAVVLSSYADERQAVVQHQIEGIVTQGLRTIFGEDLAFKVVNKMVGRRPEIDFMLVSRHGDTELETSILDARGGGVAAVAGFLLQAVLVLLVPNQTPVLFLDEVFSQVSVDFLPAVSSFIRELVDRTDLQVVMVTHSDVFTDDADRVYRFTQSNGLTRITDASH
jgi:DNA repair exonuclease SbcCD ATPase subunit